MKLYQINDAIEAILDGYELLDEETGEILGLDSLEELQMERTEKLEGIGCYVKGMTADIDALKAEEAALAERRKKLTAKRDRIRDFLQMQLAGEKLKTARIAISYTTSHPVVVDDLDKIPEQYLRIIPEQREADKNAIKAAIKQGIEVAGAHQDFKVSMTIK